MSEDIRRPERPWATGVLVVSGLISLSFNVRHSLTATSLPGPLALLYGAGPVGLAAAQSHVVAIQAARGELVSGWRKAFTFGLVIGALALSFLGIYDLLQHTVPNPFHGFPVNVPAVLTPIVIDLMAIAALNELLRTPNHVRDEKATVPGVGAIAGEVTFTRGPVTPVAPGHNSGGHTNGRATTGATASGATSGWPQGHNAAGAISGGAPPVAPNGGPTKPISVAPTTAKSNLVEFAPRGETQAAMRAHWDSCVKVGQIPTGADLNRAVEKDPKYSLGRKYARAWREKLPAVFVEAVDDGRTDDAAAIARESAAGAGEEVGS